MAFGIPSLYIASSDSQLAFYASQYEHGKCFSKSELDLAAKWIREIANNSEDVKRLSENALNASFDFKRENANRFVKMYME